MGPANCAVIGCHNSTKKLKKWLGNNSGSEPPYRLFKFPSILRNGEKREKWIDILRRETRNKTKWKPCDSDRVCSEHFVDGEPTVHNPNPTLKLGYELNKAQPRRQIIKHPLPNEKPSQFSEICTSSSASEDVLLPPPLYIDVDLSSPISGCSDHSYCRTPTTDTRIDCESCNFKGALIISYNKKLQRLTKENRRLKRETLLRANTKVAFSYTMIKTDKKMNFYTGLSSIKLFEGLFLLLKPYLSRLTYWRGTKRSKKEIKCRTFKKSTQKKLSPRNEFLSVLMRLRLGILNEDLADRFGISTTTCSDTFKTWIRFLNESIGVLVAWLPKEAIMENMPKVYKKAGHSNLRVVIDCAEVFIERPKSLESQAATWSDYKSHNTIKFLIGISPAGFITFISDAYGGRASDKFICSDSGFYDCLERNDEVMADRGFQIKEELMMNFCTLSVPPGARVKSQMTGSECKKTKDIANLRIHVERAINRIKTYRILKSVLSITMLHHIDDIIRTCASLCNLKSLLFKSSVDT